MIRSPSDIDFARGPRHLRISGWPLLAAALVSATAIGSWWHEARDELAGLDAQIARLQRPAGDGRPRGQPDPQLEAAIRAANDSIDQLALPWDRLFGAVEGAAMEGIDLLGILPDAKTGNVRIRATAADPEAMFEYARRLAGQPGLTRVFLVEHRPAQGKAAGALQFAVDASWLEKKP
jgi:hypothetical protein